MTTQEMLRWYRDPTENANDSFEAIGEWFQDETRRLRPGKSWPYEWPEPQDNKEVWQAWCEEKKQAFRLGLVRLAAREEEALKLARAILAADEGGWDKWDESRIYLESLARAFKEGAK